MRSFGEALVVVKEGGRARRKGWNGKGMYIYYVFMPLPFHHEEFYTQGGVLEWRNSEFIVMKTANNGLVPWLASQSDLLANDWEVL